MSRPLWRINLSFIAGIVFWNACLADAPGSDKLAWFKLLSKQVTLCTAKLGITFAASPCEIGTFDENGSMLCLAKCYPPLNHAQLG